MLNLVYKTRNSINEKYGEWKTKKQYNPLDSKPESSETNEEIFFNNNSLFIELPDKLKPPGEVKEAVREALRDKLVVQYIDAKAKKQANIVLRSPEDAKKAEDILKEHFLNKKPRITIV